MKRNIVYTFLLSFVVLSVAIAQDELSGEIDKLESGQVESKSSVPTDPTQSAEDIENELNEEFGIESTKKEEVAEPEVQEEAPEELPEEVAGANEEEPVVEETKSPEELDLEEEEPVKKAEQFDPIDPPAPIIEEEIVEEPVVEEPDPVVEEEAPAPPPQIEPEPEAPAYVETVPDDFEERMHRIYSQFYTEATSDSAWTQIAGEKIKETYTIQPGDTLWDISVTFFGNGHYWPKVWQMNDGITNPHSVSAGYVLKFVPGQIDQAPQLNITNNEETELVPGTTELATKIEDPNVAQAEAAPFIPPPEKKYVPVLKDLPPSLPYLVGARSSGFDRDGFDLSNKKPAIQDAKVYLTSYLSEEKPVNVGKIIEMNEDGGETATLYETVFVQMEGGAQIGEKLVVFGMGPKIEDSLGRNMGFAVIQEAEIQIQELVNEKEDVYKAIVLRSISSAKVGSLVSRGSLAVGNLNMSATSAPINAEIVGGSFDNERKVLGYQDVVYLSKGSDDGLKNGQVYSVLKNVKSRKESSMVESLKEQVAKIKIIKTTNARSTAIVLNSTQFMRPGDFIGEQGRIPKPDEIQSKDDVSSDDNSDIEQELE